MINANIKEPSLEENRLLQTREEFSLLFDHAPKDRAIFKDEAISALLQGLIDFHIMWARVRVIGFTTTTRSRSRLQDKA